MQFPLLDELERAAREIYQHMLPSPQLNWPLLDQRCQCKVWVKHENHNPTGAFKVRGGLLYVSRLLARNPEVRGVATATRGNHGQSIAFAAGKYDLPTLIVVPEGNSVDKNHAMEALGAELIVHGRDFDEAVPHAQALANDRGFERLPSFHRDLVLGVASYALELMQACPGLERVYVPIGLGSGICGVACAAQALGRDIEIVGVVSSAADAYARSFLARSTVSTDSAETLADGMAVRQPDPDALEMMLQSVSRIVSVDDHEVLAAMQAYFADTHNVAEGAGAAALAALLQEREHNAGSEVGVVLTGGNVSQSLYLQALTRSEASL